VELGHDTVAALESVVALVNTSPDCAGHEAMADVATLQAFVDHHQVSEIDHLDDDDLRSVRRLRGRLHAVFLAAADTGDPHRVVSLVNAIVADARTTPRLTDHGNWPLHMHYFAPGAAVAEHLAADCGMALAFVLAAGERDRLRQCAAPDCSRVLVDLSRNRSRRYCDAQTCGNRLHVAAYRARRRA
jgi:predicted RNA-binding Zn ribbon-like protein